MVDDPGGAEVVVVEVAPLPSPPMPPPHHAAVPAPLRRAASEGATCRICFDDATTGVLFKPCLCDGSMKFIHVHCLDQWREVGGARGGA